MSTSAAIYAYAGGYHEVVINGATFRTTNLELDRLLADHGATGRGDYRNGPPPGFSGDYSRGCRRHSRPVRASLDRPCCEPAAEEIYTWWDEIKAIRDSESPPGGPGDHR